MMNHGMTDYLCYIPYDFTERGFTEYDTSILDQGMGIESEDIFRYTLDIIFGTITLDEVVDYLDRVLFPEHVPNSCAEPYIHFCIDYITYLMDELTQYRKHLNILVINPTRVTFNKVTSTLVVRFKI